MPGFIDTHHHQFETALRSFLADGILINDHSNTPSGNGHLLRIHPAHVRAGVPSGGCLHHGHRRRKRKWKGKLLRRQLEASRDYVFSAAGIPQDLFRDN
jgi:hypothetical protein